jgi:hypothetical protein
MEHYVGLDVSLKLTAICIVDRTGRFNVKEWFILIRKRSQHSSNQTRRMSRGSDSKQEQHRHGYGPRSVRAYVGLTTRRYASGEIDWTGRISKCGDKMLRSYLYEAMLKKASALHTLIHQRHPTPSCGGHAPTAERTMNPARMFLESLDRRPGIRERPGSSTDLGARMS